jgi:hypothetical protein
MKPHRQHRHDAGAIMALVAAVFGFTDFFGSERVRGLTDAWLHMAGNLIAVVLAAINWYLRPLAEQQKRRRQGCPIDQFPTFPAVEEQQQYGCEGYPKTCRKNSRGRLGAGPAPKSHIDAVAHAPPPVIQKATSVAKAVTRKTTGNGMSIGWIGCPAICAVLRGLGMASLRCPSPEHA